MPGACSIYTEGAAGLPTAATEVSAITIAGRRVFLTNIIIDTSDTKLRGPGGYAKASWGLILSGGAEVWLVESIVAFFRDANIKSVDSYVYVIGAPPQAARASCAARESKRIEKSPDQRQRAGVLMFHGELFNDTGNGDIVFLQSQDTAVSDVVAQPLTLYVSNTTYHHDNLLRFAPIYVGPLWSTPQASVVRGTLQGFFTTIPQARVGLWGVCACCSGEFGLWSCGRSVAWAPTRTRSS